MSTIDKVQEWAYNKGYNQAIEDAQTAIKSVINDDYTSSLLGEGVSASLCAIKELKK